MRLRDAHNKLLKSISIRHVAQLCQYSEQGSKLLQQTAHTSSVKHSLECFHCIHNIVYHGVVQA